MSRAVGLKHVGQAKRRNPVDNSNIISSVTEEATEEEKYRASLIVCGHVADMAVAKEILEILGLVA